MPPCQPFEFSNRQSFPLGCTQVFVTTSTFAGRTYPLSNVHVDARNSIGLTTFRTNVKSTSISHEFRPIPTLELYRELLKNPVSFSIRATLAILVCAVQKRHFGTRNPVMAMNPRKNATRRSHIIKEETPEVARNLTPYTN